MFRVLSSRRIEARRETPISEVKSFYENDIIRIEAERETPISEVKTEVEIFSCERIYKNIIEALRGDFIVNENSKSNFQNLLEILVAKGSILDLCFVSTEVEICENVAQKKKDIQTLNEI